MWLPSSLRAALGPMSVELADKRVIRRSFCFTTPVTASLIVSTLWTLLTWSARTAISSSWVSAVPCHLQVPVQSLNMN